MEVLAMTTLRKRMDEDLQLQGLSKRTQDAYVRAVRMLAQHGLPAGTAKIEDLQQKGLLPKAPDKLVEAELRFGKPEDIAKAKLHFELSVEYGETQLRFKVPAQAFRAKGCDYCAGCMGMSGFDRGSAPCHRCVNILGIDEIIDGGNSTLSTYVPPFRKGGPRGI
jgi:hypothetical protein